MNIILTVIQVVATIIGLVIASMSLVLFIAFRWPNTTIWGLKIFTSALSSVFMLIGLVIFVIGFVSNSIFLGVVGIYSAMIYLLHFISVTRSPKGEFEKVFGNNWKTQIKPEQKKYFLSHRTVFKLPSVPEPRFEQNISFATIPGTDRELLCDIWQPHMSVKCSGVAFIYMHGAAFYFLDKDYQTRPFFKHLAAQGHVVMDIAYRLSPETDLMGMIQDVKRAIVWMKDNAAKYKVDPDRIILGGGSSGGYLALMAGYTINDVLFTPLDLDGKNMSVCAIIAAYPATDLEALYFHTNQHLTTREVPGRPKKKIPAGMPSWMKARMGEDFHRLGMDKDFSKVGTISLLMGGHPDECPERYKFFSPLTHVNSNCPPTLFIQGTHDIMAPVKASCLLYDRLVKEKNPAIMHVLPQTDHAFDLIWPTIAPSAHNAFYDVERFMALIANLKKAPAKLRLKNEMVNT